MEKKKKSNNKFNYLNIIKECYKNGINIPSISISLSLLSCGLIGVILCNIGLFYFMITGQTINVGLYIGIPILLSPFSILIGALYLHFSTYSFYKEMSSNRYQSEDILLGDVMKVQEYSAKIDNTYHKVNAILCIAIVVSMVVLIYGFGVYLVFFK